MFETEQVSDGNGAVINNKTALTAQYAAGQSLVASANGYLTNESTDGYEANAGGSNTVIGIVKMAPDNTQDELVYDQRI